MKIKHILKRYRLFFALAAVNLAVGLAMPEIGLKSLSVTGSNLREMLSVIPPIFVLLGLLDVWVDRATVMKYTGKGSGVKGCILSLLLGSAAAGPLYAAFPVATVMLKKGSSIFNVLVFIGAWSTTKIPMLTFEAANLGLRYMLLRLMFSLIGIFAIACLLDHMLTQEDRRAVYELQE